MSDYFYSIGMILRHECFKCVKWEGTCAKSIALSKAYYQLSNEENQ